MQIIEKNISDLVPYENNPRRNEDAVQYVKASIQEFGFKVPVIIDKDNVIIAGHTRLLAAKELEMEKIPCILADDLSEEQVKAFRLADNKVAETSAWDYEKLEQELNELSVDEAMDDLEKELDAIDMVRFGFSDTKKIEWDDVPDLTEDSYKEPEKVKLKCPKCGHVAGKEFFKKA